MAISDEKNGVVARKVAVTAHTALGWAR